MPRLFYKSIWKDKGTRTVKANLKKNTMKESVYESRQNVQPLLSRLYHRGKGKSPRSMEQDEELRNRSRQICPTHLKKVLFIYFWLSGS